jgi:hypothetical protein
MSRAAIFALAIVLWPMSAGAQSVKSVLESFGLLNTAWATDCSKPADDANTHIRYSVLRNGQVRLVYKNGPKYQDSVYVISSARRLSESEVSMTESDIKTKVRLEIVLRVERDRYSYKSSTRGDGTVLVRDGKFANGAASPWINRCR